MFDFLGLKKKTARTKILVIDDEPNIVQTLQDRLEMIGRLSPSFDGIEFSDEFKKLSRKADSALVC